MNKVAIPLLLVVMLGLMGAQFYTINRLHSVEQQLADAKSDQLKTAESSAREINDLKNSHVTTAAEQEKTIADVRQEITHSGQQAQGIVTHVEEENQKRLTELAAKLSASESNLQAQQQQADDQLKGEISGLKQATSSAQSDIVSVSKDVTSVKAEVATTRGQLEGTIADLRRTTGDMNVLSGRIATNSKEVAALKQLGDRNYVEFMVFKRKDPVRLGDISILLTKVDSKHNLYTVVLIAEDRKIEKKDRGINEPVQFFLGRDKQPHEFVVNQINRDQIVGYLAMPKVPESRP